jgi:IclR family pca regulon transcriptional regulator
VGRSGPPHRVAPGIVLLGALDEKELETALRRSTANETGWSIALLRQQVARDREQGWSFRSVPVENFSEIAVPLFNRQGRIIASLSVLTQLSKVPADEAIERYLPRIKRAAEEINKVVAFKDA